MAEGFQPRLSMDLVSHVVPESGGKYSVSVVIGGVESVVSEEQLMQKSATNRNSVDLYMVAMICLG